MDKNLEYIQKGKTGCTFATFLSKNPANVGWRRTVNPTKLDIDSFDYVVSYIFPDGNKESVLEWCLSQGFYLEEITDKCLGLRLKIGKKVSYVQYFGPDSHCKTRQTPYSEILFCTQLAPFIYHKVKIDKILHLAHSFVGHIRKTAADKFWKSSHQNTAAILGHKPTVVEAAKTTFLK